MKRVVAGLLILLQVLVFIPTPLFAEETTTVIIHYLESEGNDKEWNLWIWPAGGEGSVYEFTSEDNFGKVATAVFNTQLSEVGFIVRTDSWEKDIPADRFITQFDNGVGEIWVIGGQEEFYYENPNGPDGITDESVDLSVNYHNYDENYNQVTMTATVGELVTDIPVVPSDFGLAGKVHLDGTFNQPEILVTVYDQDTKVAYSVMKIKNGAADVYFIENSDRVYYSEADADYIPKFIDAKLMDTQTIVFSTNMPFKATEDNITVTVNGETKAVGSLMTTPYNDKFISGASATLILKDKVSYTDTITIDIPKFETGHVQLGDVYDSLEFNNSYNYDGELGPIYSKDETVFKVWAPTARAMELRLYDDYKGNHSKTFEMSRDDQGVWSATVEGDLHNQLYRYGVMHQSTFEETVDPYAKAVTVNGSMSAVVDLDRTNPENWDENYKTDFTSPVDAIMYEIHVRDLSMHNESGIENKGLFLGFTELNTMTSNGFSTGLSYIKDLGVTHIQLMPIYDYGSVDESKDSYEFNWGYDPVNYNALEGSYATDPFTPDVRMMEFKEAVQAIHDQDLKVTMDVVYNHVFSLNAMAFEKLVPGYYFRKEDNGNYANGSGCGNETASERYMMQKFMIDSVTYLASEYHLDGFRFDLMGLHDVETMNKIREALNQIDPSITIIGEGWNLGIVLDENNRANQNQAYEMSGIAHFNDTIRDGLKGSVFDRMDQGFVSGKSGMAGIVFSGIIGGVDFDTYSTWGNIDPTQSVTYVEAHDNNTLFDKLSISNPEDDLQTIKQMHMLADSIILTSQGIPFIHSGQEFMRTKFGDENSYKSSDIINRLDWTRREKYDDVVNYFKALIAMRKAHPSFRLETAEAVNEHIKSLQASNNLIVYSINGVEDDSWQEIVVIHNANREEVSIDLPNSGTYEVVVSGPSVNLEGLYEVGGSVTAEPLSTVVLYHVVSPSVVDESDSSMLIWYLAGAIVVILAGTLIFIKKKK
ncbi:MAG: type I pullulanase [Clostridia bacterium]|nr:type I pullulanase [Clostridia bacterium]